MNNKSTQLNFWFRWLVAADIIVIAFGAAQALLPDLVRQGFSLLVFGSASYINTFPQDAIRYITLTHAVMGSVMIGWGVSVVPCFYSPSASSSSAESCCRCFDIRPVAGEAEAGRPV